MRDRAETLSLRSRRLALLPALLLILVGTLSSQTLGQIPLPGQGGSSLQSKHLSFKAQFKPEKAAPGDEVQLILDVEILDGWYIYDPDPITEFAIPTKVTITSEALENSSPMTFPKGKEKDQDKKAFHTRYHEGKIQIVGKFKVKAGTKEGALSVDTEVSYQACNTKNGVCAPPAKENQTATLLVTATSSSTSKEDEEKSNGEETPAVSLKPKDLIGDLINPGGAVTEPEVTWSFSIEPEEVPWGGKAKILATYEIADTWHIYTPDFKGTGIPTSLKIPETIAKLKGDPTFPEPHIIEVEFGPIKEKQRTLEGLGIIEFPIELRRTIQPGTHELKVSIQAQACTTKGVCKDANGEETLTLVVKRTGPNKPDSPSNSVQSSSNQIDNSNSADETKKNQTSGPSKQTDDGFWLFILSAIGWGLFTLLMPCTYPMIPITISYFTKQAENSNKSLFPLALAYGGGIVFDFILIGLLAGALGNVVGQKVNNLAANPWLNLVLALAFIVFALSLFGLFELRLPSAIMNLSGKASQSGGYLGVFFLGTTLVITSFTCTAPFVGALLGQAIQYEWWEIAIGMGAFGLTMAIPFIALGLFPSATQKMPKSGQWMNTLKVSLGFLEIAAAFKFISNVDLAWSLEALPRELFLMIWAGISFVVGLFLLGVIPLKSGATNQVGPLQMVIAVLVIIFGAYCTYGSQGWQMDRIMNAIIPDYSGQRVSVSHSANPEVSSNEPVIVEDDFEGGLALALQKGQLALVNWTGKL